MLIKQKDDINRFNCKQYIQKHKQKQKSTSKNKMKQRKAQTEIFQNPFQDVSEFLGNQKKVKIQQPIDPETKIQSFNQNFNEIFDENYQTELILEDKKEPINLKEKKQKQPKQQTKPRQPRKQKKQPEVLEIVYHKIDDEENLQKQQQNQVIIQNPQPQKIEQLKNVIQQPRENQKMEVVIPDNQQELQIIQQQFLIKEQIRQQELQKINRYLDCLELKDQNKKIQQNQNNIATNNNGNQQNYCQIEFKKTINLAEENLECQICNIEYSEGDKLALLECIHRYHLECFTHWQKKSKLCPICQN